MLVVGLVSQGGGDLLDINGVQVKHRVSVGLLPIAAPARNATAAAQHEAEWVTSARTT